MAVYSSPYLRSIQTVEPLASARNLPVEAFEDFREHKLAEGPIAHWMDVLRDGWNDLDHIPEGGDPMRSTLTRGLGVLSQIVARLQEGVVALAGHGTINSLVLHSVDPTIGFDFHLAMSNPAIHRLDWDGKQWVWRHE